MRTFIFTAIAVALLTALPATAELQNVTVGGEIHIRGDYYHNVFNSPTAGRIIWPGFQLPGRAIGSAGNDVISRFRWDDEVNDTRYISQRTRLNVNADFTDKVSAFVELDSYDTWGEDFRSNWITGADGRSVTNDDVEVYQAYILAQELWGTPLLLKIGRQEVTLGSGWLVGGNDSGSVFTGLPLDAIILAYATDQFVVNAFTIKAWERGAVEEDGDIDLYGVYGTYKGIENVNLDAYWILGRDARSQNDTNGTWAPEWLENVLDLDDYDVTNINTVGLRGAGTLGAFDFEAEAAYQFGNASAVGASFRPYTYGDDKADFDAYAGNLEVGYTFDAAYTPRVFLGAAYFSGEDNRDVSLGEWLNPFDRPQASLSFNRLFSNWRYSEFLDFTDLSNAFILRGGVEANPTESTNVKLLVTHLESVAGFDAPRSINVGRYRIPLNPTWSWWTSENSQDLGWEVGLYGTYHYTQDLTVQAGYAHLFVGDGLSEGNFNSGNGLSFNGGTSDDGADYVFVDTRLSF